MSTIQYVPGSTRRICQLTGDTDPEGLPHVNQTVRWGIEGTDRGVPVEHRGKLFLFLGDAPSVRDADPIVYTTDKELKPGGFTLHPVLEAGRNQQKSATAGRRTWRCAEHGRVGEFGCWAACVRSAYFRCTVQ